jgi:hypothetical protein
LGGKDDKKWREFRQRWLARFGATQKLDRMKTSTLTNTRIFFGLLVAGLLASNAAVASSSVIPSGFLTGDQAVSEI